jgi:hypothetical protein
MFVTSVHATLAFKMPKTIRISLQYHEIPRTVRRDKKKIEKSKKVKRGKKLLISREVQEEKN